MQHSLFFTEAIVSLFSPKIEESSNNVPGQLQKMGILESSKQQKPNVAAAKRRSAGIDFSGLNPLKSTGTVGFSAFRDTDTSTSRKGRSRKKSNGGFVGEAMAEDSEEDDDDINIVGRLEDVDDKDPKALLSPDDAKFSGELAGGIERIKVGKFLELSYIIV
jgi:hypothetical protein